MPQFLKFTDDATNTHQSDRIPSAKSQPYEDDRLAIERAEDDGMIVAQCITPVIHNSKNTT